MGRVVFGYIRRLCLGAYRIQRQPYSPDERGNAIVEFAVILPFLALLTTGMIDLGYVLNEYLRMTEAAHEGARMASGQLQFRTLMEKSGLTPGQLGCPSATVGKVPSLPTELTKHRDVQERVETFLNIQTSALAPTSLCIRSSLSTGSAPTSAPEKNVRVSISARYSSFFPFLFNNLEINVQATAPFLQG